MTDDTETTIAELYARDPMEHSRQDVERIIAQCREDRARYNAGGKTLRPKKAAKISLEDLGL